MKITLSRMELQAALLFASQDETRYTLSGVCVEAHHGGQPVLVATDGIRLVSIESRSDQIKEQEQDFTSAILRADFLKPLCVLSKAIGGKLFPWITFTLKNGSKRVIVELVGKPLFLEIEDGGLVEGDYPNWRGIIPAATKGRTAITDIALNASFVGDFAKAARALGSESSVAQFNLVGKEAIVEVNLKGLPNFYGIINQCKLDESVDYQPEFLAIQKLYPRHDPEAELEKVGAE